jgi:hypothetical protein
VKANDKQQPHSGCRLSRHQGRFDYYLCKLMSIWAIRQLGVRVAAELRQGRVQKRIGWHRPAKVIDSNLTIFLGMASLAGQRVGYIRVSSLDHPKDLVAHFDAKLTEIRALFTGTARCPADGAVARQDAGQPGCRSEAGDYQVSCS